ncbi:MAG: helix-turn-helix transcriptional regulator [Deltaproteobacteria bacterium]|nr:helix-turn-helix transcriptional regulator [Deltaproteobacteria bacterium]
MLSARADIEFGAARLRSLSVLERSFRAYVACRENLIFDTRFSSAAQTTSPCAHLFFMLAGTMTIVGRAPQQAPVAFLLTDDEADGAGPFAPHTFRTEGTQTHVLYVRVPAEMVRGMPGLAHGALALDDACWDAARRVIDDAITDRVRVASYVTLFEHVERHGLISAAVVAGIVDDEPAHFVRLWSALQPSYGILATSVSLKELAAQLGVSRRQLTRDATEMARTFHWPGGAFRDAMRMIRLRIAAILLSAPEATVPAVAARTGYSTTTAMGRAFRDAGLPSPTEVQSALRTPSTD